MIRATDWRPLQRNALQSFVIFALPSGLILQERTYHRTSSGAECIGLPIRPQRNRTGRRLKDYADSRDPGQWTPERFQAARLPQMHELLATAEPAVDSNTRVLTKGIHTARREASGRMPIMTGTPSLRLTVSAARSDSPVLLGDSGPLFDLAAVHRVISEIDSAFVTHADFLFAGGAELVIRLAERSFRPLPPDALRSPPHRALPPGEF